MQEEAIYAAKALAEKVHAGKIASGVQLLGNQPQQPLSSKINSALDLAKATLDQLNSVADRTLGSYPQPVPNYTDTAATYVSTARQVEELTDVLHQIAGVSQRLSGGL